MKTSTQRISKNYLILFLLFNLFLTSCKKNDPGIVVNGVSKVKMVNAVQTEASQDVYIDDQKVTTSALAFGENSDYLKVQSGSRSLYFMGTTLKTAASMNFTPSLTYTTFLASDRLGNREVLNYEDNLSNTDPATAKIKLINLTPFFTTGINIMVQSGTQFVNGLLYKESSNYFSVETGAVIQFNVLGSGVIKTIPAAAFESGKTYTIWFSGATTTTLEAHIILNN